MQVVAETREVGTAALEHHHRPHRRGGGRRVPASRPTPLRLRAGAAPAVGVGARGRCYATVWDSYAGDGVIGEVDGDVATAIALHLGICYRTIGDAEHAVQAFGASGALADWRGDERACCGAAR